MDGDLSTMRLRSFFDTRYSFELALQWNQFEVNKNPMSEALPVFLESGTCASREEAVEEMKESRSMVRPWCRSTVITEHGTSLFHDRINPRSHHKLPRYLFMCFLSHC